MSKTLVQRLERFEVDRKTLREAMSELNSRFAPRYRISSKDFDKVYSPSDDDKPGSLYSLGYNYAERSGYWDYNNFWLQIARAASGFKVQLVSTECPRDLHFLEAPINGLRDRLGTDFKDGLKIGRNTTLLDLYDYYIKTLTKAGIISNDGHVVDSEDEFVAVCVENLLSGRFYLREKNKVAKLVNDACVQAGYSSGARSVWEAYKTNKSAHSQEQFKSRKHSGWDFFYLGFAWAKGTHELFEPVMNILDASENEEAHELWR